jgi:uncharacterized membrane protein (UPF0182 family)
MEMFMTLFLNAAIVILIIVFIYKKVSVRSNRTDAEMHYINQRLEKIEHDIEELKK